MSSLQIQSQMGSYLLTLVMDTQVATGPWKELDSGD